ncbi:lipopolysaccharide biosynthesis protein [Ferrimonas senticii]|uniref:lipopolysaccharide biosynthesis protein n=1 Tax=Ferrimonas senticii TaxID=394566 RepID=UPI0004254606|nr:oligosaccharide flippase family protein [Ferrimonas senticii]
MSAFNFALNLALLKWWSSEDFGLYSILFSASFMILCIQNALITTPYSVLVPASDNPEPLRRTLAWGHLGSLLILAVLLLMLLPLLPFGWSLSLSLAAAAYFCSRWLREYLRNRWAAEFKLLPILTSDLLGIGLFAAGITAIGLHWGWSAVGVTELLYLMSLSQLLCSLPMLWHELQLLRSGGQHHWWQQYQPIWQQSRWSLVGALTTELQNRGYVLFIGAFFGAAVVGFVQAGRVFFGPLNVITSAWTRVAKPTLAQLHGQHQWPQFIRLTHLGGLGFLLFNVVFASALWLSWPWLQQQFFADKYPGIEWVVAQWALATLLFHVRGSYSTAVQAQNRFQELAMATIWGALLSLLVLVLVGLVNQPQWVIAGVLAAETLVLLYVLRLLLPARDKVEPQQC